MEKYKLIALDMDGTLLMSDKRVHPDTVRDIAYAAERGVNIVYSTGRGPVELKPVARELPMIRWGICASGSQVYDFVEKKPVFRKEIPGELVREVIRIVGEDTGMINFLTDSQSLARADQIARIEEFHMKAFQKVYEEVATTVPSMAEEAKRHESVPKMNIYFRSPEAREEAYEELRHLPLTFIMTEKTSLEITAEGVTKALGLQKLAEYLGIPLEETVGMGDGDNDRALLEIAGFAVAMRNATPGIQRICDFVTDDNDHNGVGKAIRRLIG